METKTYKNLLITERDKDILSLLQKLKVSSSSNLRKILSPETSQNTFTKRLKRLEESQLVKRTWESFRSRSQHWIYQLNILRNGKRIEQITWNETIWKNVWISHSSYWHSVNIWHLLWFLLKHTKKAAPGFKFSADKFISQYEFQKRLNTEWDTKKCPIVPDGLLIQWKVVYWLEVERMNSIKDFRKKIQWYYELSFRLGKWSMPYFEKGANHVLILMSPDNKIGFHENVIKDENIESSWKLKLIKESKILWESI